MARRPQPIPVKDLWILIHTTGRSIYRPCVDWKDTTGNRHRYEAIVASPGGPPAVSDIHCSNNATVGWRLVRCVPRVVPFQIQGGRMIDDEEE